MLCDNCKKNNAVFHYKHSENGVTNEAHLCMDCADKLGFTSGNSGFAKNYADLFDGYFMNGGIASALYSGFGASNVIGKAKVCQSCGMSENEFISGGKFGCKECYGAFADTVVSMLKKYQLSTEYKGKVPTGNAEYQSLERKVAKLRDDMQKAVENQEYEEAAKIRDAIKQLQESDEKSDGRE